jgi:hypothetical protein
MKHQEYDFSEMYGRGPKNNRSKCQLTDEERIKKEKTTFNQIKDVDSYYLNQDNYKDDVPFDLYNMVSLAKRIDFKSKLDLNITDVTKEVLKRQFDEQNNAETVEDLARKHLAKEVVFENGQPYVKTYEELNKENEAKLLKSHS